MVVRNVLRFYVRVNASVADAIFRLALIALIYLKRVQALQTRVDTVATVSKKCSSKLKWI